MLLDSFAHGSVTVPESCVIYTPTDLATAMVSALGNTPDDKWLEPCVGKGALLNALAANGVRRKQITGLDIAAQAEEADRLAKVQRGQEFLKWSLETKLRFTKIVANPPFVAIERLHTDIRTAIRRVSERSPIEISQSGNAWHAFLVASINLLLPGGSLCFVLPAAWDFANYAGSLRSKIPDMFEQVEIYRSRSPLFQGEGVQEGAIVMVARSLRPDRLSFAASGSVAFRQESVSKTGLISNLLSSRYIDRTAAVAPNRPSNTLKLKTAALGNVISLRLGAVTGDATFFVLSESERRYFRLPLSSVQPVLTRSRHLSADVTTFAQWNRLKENDEKVWLFRPSTRGLRTKAVQAYLKYGEQGGCKLSAHKIANRSPWYGMSMPNPIDGFLSGMSGSGPWISLNTTSELGATNTLYVVQFLEGYRAINSRYAVALSLLTSDVQSQLQKRGRRYADGLLKFEPCDILQANIPLARNHKSVRSTYSAAIQELLSGRNETAVKLADRWFSENVDDR